jgi:hypothetical protein
MKRLALYTTAFNLSVDLEDRTIVEVTRHLIDGEMIVISDTAYGEPVTYWINPANVAAIVITEPNE